MIDKANNLSREWIYKEYVNREDMIIHAPFETEYDFYSAVKSGDEKRVKKFLQKSFTSIEGLGVLSDNSLRNFKYHFIITAAMISRSCIEAGMSHERAYSLSDFYIQKVDKLNDLKEIDKLHDEMALAYTDIMHKLRSDRAYSKPITKCINYIYSHLHTRITLDTLASEASLSPSYLSRLFKQELNMSISEYIEHQKIETAKNMLLYSDYSPSEIATILGFPSQSYFTERFRKATGTTPKKYQE